MARPISKRTVEVRHAARRIAIYNHKGGVGKTTLTVNIAAAIAQQGYRVLLVDADPQCNLTSYFLEESVVDDLLDNSDSDDGETLWSAVRPLVDSEGDIKHIHPVELSTEGLALLPGDIRLSEFEQDLWQAWGECFQRRNRGYKSTTALSRLINWAAAAAEVDFVFFDSGPNIGPLNRTILLDCDYFIIPAACDLFSVRALKTLGHTLASWAEDWATVVDIAPENTYLLPGRPRLLGYVPQRFRVYAGQVASGQARIIPMIERRVHSEIIAPLRNVYAEMVPSKTASLRLGLVKDFSSLAAAAQSEGVPIKDVSQATDIQKAEAAAIFEEIAVKITDAVSGEAE